MSTSKFKPQTPSDTSSVASDITTGRRPARVESAQTTPRKDLATTLYNGEVVPKSDRIISVIGTIDELAAYIGIIKTEHFDPNTEEKLDIDSSAKLFLYARLTQIQETLIDIEASIGTSRKVIARHDFTRFSNGEQRIKDLENEIELMRDVNLGQLKESMKEKPFQHIPGNSVIEAKLFYARTICRRAERQLCGTKNLPLGIILEDNCMNYLNKLGDYLLALSIHVLHMQNKEPLKKVTRTNTRTAQPNLK